MLRSLQATTQVYKSDDMSCVLQGLWSWWSHDKTAGSENAGLLISTLMPLIVHSKEVLTLNFNLNSFLF